jgi:predicted nucleotidyltransferase
MRFMRAMKSAVSVIFVLLQSVAWSGRMSQGVSFVRCIAAAELGYNVSMKREEALELLRSYKNEHAEEFGIVRLGLFGSVARDEAGEESDVDVVIETKQPNLFRLSRIRLELEELMHTHVDLVTYRAKMNPFLKARILKEAVYA